LRQFPARAVNAGIDAVMVTSGIDKQLDALLRRDQ